GGRARGRAAGRAERRCGATTGPGRPWRRRAGRRRRPAAVRKAAWSLLLDVSSIARFVGIASPRVDPVAADSGDTHSRTVDAIGDRARAVNRVVPRAVD